MGPVRRRLRRDGLEGVPIDRLLRSGRGIGHLGRRQVLLCKPFGYMPKKPIEPAVAPFFDRGESRWVVVKFHPTNLNRAKLRNSLTPKLNIR